MSDTLKAILAAASFYAHAMGIAFVIEISGSPTFSSMSLMVYLFLNLVATFWWISNQPVRPKK
jgi:hypothetical protein